LTADELAAINGAAAPAAGNVFATMADVGSGGGSLADWALVPDTDPLIADADVSQLRGEMSAVPWADAQVSYGGPRALSSYVTAVDSKLLVLRPDFSGPNTDTQGIFRAAPSGDFIYGARIGWARNSPSVYAPATSGLDNKFLFTFWDSATVSAGAGHFSIGYWQSAAETAQTADLVAGSHANWQSLTIASVGASEMVSQGSIGTMDVFIQRSGTDISFWGGSPGMLHYFGVVSGVADTLAGLIGFTFRNATSKATQAHRGHVYAFAKLTAVPGL